MDCYQKDHIWLHSYPVRYAGTRFEARTTVVRLGSGQLWVHSPGPIDDELESEVRELGDVAHLVAPGNYHYLHVCDWQRAFPEAQTWICPGVEKKAPELEGGQRLPDQAPAAWADELDQVLVLGARFICEAAFFHRATGTPILVDLIENIGPTTANVDRVLKFWWHLLRMWGRPRPAPEYWFSWKDRSSVRAALERILSWDFDRIVIAHGDLIEQDARCAARRAWQGVLGSTPAVPE